MAAYTTGASWGFPSDLPGSWSQDDVDAQLHTESSARRASTAAETHSSPSDQTSAKSHAGAEKKKKSYYRPRTCRICLEAVQPSFNTDDFNSAFPSSMQPPPRVVYESPVGEGGRMIRPCKCKGSQKYVHEECLGAWRRQDPSQKRNYWQCPTCRYKYRLQRLAWGSWISSTISQIGLTLAIFIVTVFVLGFIADPIINLYVDPVGTIAARGGPTGSLIYEDEPATWAEHCVKGVASLGVIGFAKVLITTAPVNFFLQIRNTAFNTRGNVGGTGQARVNSIGWIAVLIGVLTFLAAVWKGVRAWSRRALIHAGERVMDVQGNDDDDDDDYED